MLVVETIVIEGDAATCVVPDGRYAGARGFWFLPTERVLATWIRRAGLRATGWTEAVATTPDEQRSTVWRQGASLREGLDPADANRTIEGYPAPRRIAVAIA